MALKCQTRIHFIHAHPIIRDHNLFGPALHNFNRNMSRHSIDGVFQKLLYHGRGPFNDLAGGNLVDNGIGQDADGTHM